MADKPKKTSAASSPYTADRGAVGAFEGETVTRRRFMTVNALSVGGIASAAFGLPALGFALGPLFTDGVPNAWQDVGEEADFGTSTYVAKVINIQPEAGEAGKTTIYVRKFDPELDTANEDLPYVAITTRCSHLGCAVRYIPASQRFGCPCHGGIYDFEGKVAGGPPVRPLDRFHTRVVNGRVEVGERFSLNSKLDRFPPRDPSSHLDGLWQYLYPSRPST